MSQSYQLTIEDMERQEYIDAQPKRIAYIDECGSFGFDFTTDGASKFYILCAVVVEDAQLDNLHTSFNEIKQWLCKNRNEVQ